MVRWTEVADEVFQRRYQPLDVTVGVVRAADGLLVVDTRSSHREADEIRTDLAAFKRPVLAVVNTHAHYDHCFGNHRVGPDSDLGAPIYGHERMPAHLATYEAPLLAGWIAERREPATAWREVVITPPSHLVGAQATLDLGDRTVELLHLGRGHTDNDLVVHVPDAATWLVGDLLEESGPPMYGSGSFPLDWPGTVGALRHAATATATLVPGHGAPVDDTFAADQQAALQQVADLLRELHAAGVPADRALVAGATGWPFPPEGLKGAVREAYRVL